MFDQFYQFSLIDHKVNPEKHVITRWMYNFETDRRRYICLVEKFARNIYIVKYYPATFGKSKKKYHVLFNDEKPARIIGTCIRIMLHHYQLDPLASFGFVGTNSINKKGKVEAKANTQRYRVYKYAVIGLFGSQSFAHSRSARRSAYLMINRKNAPKIRLFKAQAEAMFSAIYRDI
jgi:hypothetical protein